MTKKPADLRFQITSHWSKLPAHWNKLCNTKRFKSTFLRLQLVRLRHPFEIRKYHPDFSSPGPVSTFLGLATQLVLGILGPKIPLLPMVPCLFGYITMSSLKNGLPITWAHGIFRLRLQVLRGIQSWKPPNATNCQVWKKCWKSCLVNIYLYTYNIVNTCQPMAHVIES